MTHCQDTRRALFALGLALLTCLGCGPFGKKTFDCKEKLTPLDDWHVGGAAGSGSSIAFEGEFSAPVEWQTGDGRDEAQIEVRLVRTGAGDEVSYVSDRNSCPDGGKRYPVRIEVEVSDGSFDEDAETTIDVGEDGNGQAFFRLDGGEIQGDFELSKRSGASTAFTINVVDGSISGTIFVNVPDSDDDSTSGEAGSAAGGVEVLRF